MSKRQRNLTHARLLSLLVYEKHTGKFYWKVKRYNSNPGDLAGCVQKKKNYTRWQIVIDRVHHKAHRLAWFYVYGTWPKFIDHINGDATDNRIENLRVSTVEQNQANSLHPKGATGVRGISFYKNRYMAQISHKGKSKYIGRFKTLDEAKAAWDREAVRLRGEFARLD